MPPALGKTASMKMEITMQGSISRKNVRGFVQSFEDAIVNGLELESGKYRVYESQVAVDAVYTKGVEIWNRPSNGKLNSQRRLLETNQKLTVDFTFAAVENRNAM